MALASLLYPEISEVGGLIEGGAMFDPTGTSALLTAGSSVLGKALQGGAGPSRAESASRTEAIFNNSGWTVNFGDGANVSAKNDAGVSQLPGIAGNLSTTTLILFAAGALVLWKLSQKSK